MAHLVPATPVFAVLGDVHGQLDTAVKLLKEAECQSRAVISFVLQVGDLEAHGVPEDLLGMYAPHRGKTMGDFPEYFAGRKRFPWPMYFIGGNHEPYLRLESCPQDMKIAENIYFLGRAGEREIEGLRIAYLSGVYDEEYYHRTAAERGAVQDDWDWEMQRLLRCFVAEELVALSGLPRPQILLIHQWPWGLVRSEDHEVGEPFHRKLRYGETGVKVLAKLVEALAPEHVFCGHLHRGYSGTLGCSQVHCLDRVGSNQTAVMLMSLDGQVGEIWR